MGFDNDKYPLPAPTESSTLDSADESIHIDDIDTNVSTNVSNRTDRTSYSVPDDGTPPVALLQGTDLVPPVVAFGEGYINGAKAINPDIEVISTYHPGEISQAFVDPEWGAATARQGYPRSWLSYGRRASLAPSS